jgi:hypothetical protein
MKRHLHQPVTKRSATVALAMLFALALLGWGGWHLWMKFSGRPLSVAQTKRVIWKHLGKQARTKKFQLPPEAADAVIVTSMIPAPVIVTTNTTATNRPPRVRAVARTSRGPLDMPETTLSEYFRTNQAIAASYDAMYRSIGEQLKAAEAVLAGTNSAREFTALALAGEASIYARTNALDFWLSARICDAYLWPRLSLVEGTNLTPVSQDAVLTVCELAYRDASETNNMIRAYETIMARSTRTAFTDMARFRLALIYIDHERNAEALKLLKSLKSLKSAKIDREIATLERLLAEKPK